MTIDVYKRQDVSIRNPTMIRAGAVAKDGIARKIGDNSSDNPKRMAATREVSPVRPPSACLLYTSYNGMLKTYYYQFLGPRPPKKNRS